MTVALAGGNIRMEGVCRVEDAEHLLQLVLNNRRAIVDWRSCEEAHTAVIQILLAARPELLGPAANAFLQNHIAPLIGDSRLAMRSSFGQGPPL